MLTQPVLYSIARIALTPTTGMSSPVASLTYEVTSILSGSFVEVWSLYLYIIMTAAFS